MKIIICMLLFFTTVLAVSSNEYLKKENALEKADECPCKNGKCVPDKKGKLVCTCFGDYYLSGSECKSCDCGKGATGCSFSWAGTQKSCKCKKGYRSKGFFRSVTCVANCKKDTCENGGICQKKSDDVIECKCNPPFEGEYCEKKIVPTTVKTTTTKKKTTPVTSTISTKRKLPSTASTKRSTTRKVTPTTKKTSPVPVTTLKTTKRTVPSTTQNKTTVQTTTRKVTPTTKTTTPVPVTTLKTTKSTVPSTTQNKTTVQTTTRKVTPTTKTTTPVPVTTLKTTKTTVPSTTQNKTTVQTTTRKVTPTTKTTSPVPVTTLETTKRTLPTTTQKKTTVQTITNATTRSTTQVTTRQYNRTTPMPVTISETKKKELSSTMLTKPNTPQMNTTNSTTRTMYSTTTNVSYTALKTSPVTATASKLTTNQSSSTNTANTSPKLTTVRLITNNTMSVTTERITQKKTSSWPVSTPESTTKMKESTSQSFRPTTATRNVTRPITNTTSPTSSATKMRSTVPSTSTHLKTEVVTFTKSFTDELSNETTISNETTTELNTTDVNTINDHNATTAELNITEVFTDELVTSTPSYITSNDNDTETTITTMPRVYNCTTLPCRNGGTCVVEEYSTKCLCPYPYAGMRCTDSFWCTEGEGKDLCGSAKCVFNFDTEVGRCACKKAFYFDYNKKSCELVDLCPLQPDRCKGAHELCLKNECVCEENFKRNEKHECIPNYCEKHSDICAEYNATCEENEKDPINVKCVCRENEVFNGKICVKVNKCDVPSTLGCQQICNSTSEQCECNEGFSLDKDGKSCTLTADGPQKCDYNCTPGICVKYNDSEACLCPPTHAYEEGFCQDLCSAQLLPQNLCPGDACEPHPTLGFRCKCEDKFTYNEDNFTCRKKLMCSEGDGDKICANRSAKCIEDFDSVDGFMCICEDSEEMDLDGICKKQCDLQSYQENCWGQRATCEMDGDKATCKCPPLLAKGKNGYCEELAEASYMGSMPFAKKNQKVAVIVDVNNQSVSEKEYFAMKQKLRDSMRLIYGENFQFADIFDCSDFGFYYKCKVEIQFKSDPEGQVNLITDSETCIRNGPTTCYIPPALVLYSKNLRPDLLSRSDPCSKEIKLANCGGRETVCNATEDKSFYQCTCSEGFRSYSTIYPVTDRRTVIHRCEDVNECLNPRACPNRTRCLNTYGSYDCECQQGYKPNGANADVKINGCVGLCHGISCGNGKCKEDGFEYQCICDEGYSGEKCKEKVNLSGRSKGAEVALIVMSTIVVPLLLFAIFMVHKYQILRKKATGSGYLDDGSSTITMEPLTPLNLRD